MNGEQRAKRRSAYDRLPIKEFGGQNVSIYFSCRLPWLRWTTKARYRAGRQHIHQQASCGKRDRQGRL